MASGRVAQISAGFYLQFRHPHFHAGTTSLFISGENFLQWSFAFQYNYCLRAQLRFSAQQGFHGKIGNEDASKRHNLKFRFSIADFRIKKPIILHATFLS